MPGQKQLTAAEVMVIPRLLLRHPVSGCRAIVYFTQLVAHPGIKQDALGGGSFTGIDMRGDTDVAITFERMGQGMIFP
jgi:hypothetical protein